MIDRILDFEFAANGEQPERFYMTRELAGKHTEIYTVHSTTEEGDVMLEMNCGYFDEIYDHAFEMLAANQQSLPLAA